MEFKKLIEKRNDLVEKINTMFTNAEQENRAFSEEETASYEAMSKEIKDIDATIRMADAAKALVSGTPVPAPAGVQKTYETECRAFSSFIRTGKVAAELREAVNMGTGENGSIIPSTIAAKIIETVENICPIFNLTTKYNVKGSLVFPVYDEKTDSIKCAYAEEFKALESHAGKFTQVSLGGFLVGALTKISKSLINNAAFDVVGYVVSKVSLAIARFLEHEALLGTGSAACQGVLVGATQKVTAAAATAITTDELIDLQLKVAQQYQDNAAWIVNVETLAALRKLKDKEGEYLLTKDLTMGFGYMLLGKHVYLSDAMPKIEANAKPIVYGDFSGLFSNLRPSIEMNVLLEKFADEHAVGVVTWYEVDMKVVEAQKIALLEMAAA